MNKQDQLKNNLMKEGINIDNFKNETNDVNVISLNNVAGGMHSKIFHDRSGDGVSHKDHCRCVH